MDELHQGTSESSDLKATRRVTPSSLGSRIFRRRFGLDYAYVAGAMYRGIASPELVIRMGKAGLIGFFGTGGLTLDQIERGIQRIQSQLRGGEPYGMNLLANYGDPGGERKTVDLYLRYNIRNVEAAAFTQMTPALVLFRLKGLRRDESGLVVCANQVIAKVSRPEVAEAFMSPAPQQIVQQLLREGSISAAEAELGRTVPMSHDICVEADSGGHTDGAIPTVILPTMVRLRDHILRERKYADAVCVGLAGGIGTPEAAAAAFLMGADFILTGSINQCTPEAGISEDAKRLLLEMNIQDTDYAPAGDMFEMGAKVQVLKKGVFFPARANKLYGLYSHFDSLGDLPDKIQQQLQTTYFKRSFLDIWNDMRSHLEQEGRLSEIRKAELNGKYKMSLVFRWYFHYSTQLAFAGQAEDRVNYQLHTGPALGAFNQWVKGTDLEPLANRHVDEIGKRLVIESARFTNNRYSSMAELTRQESMGG